MCRLFSKLILYIKKVRFNGTHPCQLIQDTNTIISFLNLPANIEDISEFEKYNES